MPNLSIKNVPMEVVVSMRKRAAANHRSLQGELLALVSEAAAGTLPTFESRPSEGMRKGHKSIERIAAEHRQHIKQSVRKRPLSTEMIRQDRDAR